MDNHKKATLEEFARRASQRLQDKKLRKTATYHVNELDMDVVLQSLTDDELMECTEMEGIRGDMYAVYLAMVEPNLRETAVLLRESKEIAEPLEVANVFSRGDVSALAFEVMKLSGAVTGGIRAVDKKVADTLKN